MHSVRLIWSQFVLAMALAYPTWASAQNIDHIDNLIDNFHAVTPGHVYRSARPSADDFAALKAIGIKTVLSLETYVVDGDQGAWEEQAAAAAGIAMARVPMNPLPVITPSVAQIQQALNIIKTPANQPILVHCYHGSDRTGMVIGAYHIQVDGWSVDEAIADMRNYGHSWLYYGWDEQLEAFATASSDPQLN